MPGKPWVPRFIKDLLDGITLSTDSTFASNSDAKIPTEKAVKTYVLANVGAGGSPIMFSAHKNGTAQTALASGANVKATFPTEAYDVGGCYDAPNSKFTPNVAGYYQFTAALYYQGPVVDQIGVAIQLYKNGARVCYNAAKTSGTGSTTINLAFTAYANGTTDYFEIYSTHGTGQNQDISGDVTLTFFQGQKIG